MALPQTISVDQIADLEGKALSDYFIENAAYDKTSPGNRYGIRFGSKAMFAADTGELWKKFQTAIAKYRLNKTKTVEA